jgi:hypothetical protein
MRADLRPAVQPAERLRTLRAIGRGQRRRQRLDDVSAVDAHAHIGWTYDYYFKRHGRHGWTITTAPS